jgi:histidine triad (HIT) family protein
VSPGRSANFTRHSEGLQTAPEVLITLVESAFPNRVFMPTIFTKIINREVPAEIVYEDDLALAFRDISPQAPTHVLVIPKKEIVSLDALEDGDAELIGHLFVVVRKVAAQLNLANGYRTVINCGKEGGQTVDHIHIHLLAGRPLTWPPG